MQLSKGGFRACAAMDLGINTTWFYGGTQVSLDCDLTGGSGTNPLQMPRSGLIEWKNCQVLLFLHCLMFESNGRKSLT